MGRKGWRWVSSFQPAQLFAQLGLEDKGYAPKEIVLCLVLSYYGQIDKIDRQTNMHTYRQTYNSSYFLL